LVWWHRIALYIKSLPELESGHHQNRGKELNSPMDGHHQALTMGKLGRHVEDRRERV
jgi:hypothetical protein